MLAKSSLDVYKNCPSSIIKDAFSIQSYENVQRKQNVVLNLSTFQLKKITLFINV